MPLLPITRQPLLDGFWPRNSSAGGRRRSYHLSVTAGSLPREEDLGAMIRGKAQGEVGDERAFAARVQTAVGDVVRRQAEAGIDVVSDGEQGRVGFIPYVNERLAGITPSPTIEAANYWSRSREYRAFPDFYAWATSLPGAAGSTGRTRWVCTGAVSYTGHAALQRDIDNLRAAMAGLQVVEAFMPAVSPSNLANWNRNEHYRTDEDYLVALAEALHEEYRAIIDAGFTVQLDDPAIGENWDQQKNEPSVEGYRRYTKMQIDALNHAIKGLPSSKIRFHLCWGSWHGPHTTDIPMKHLVDLMLAVNADYYSFEAANARHEHEWKIWKDIKLPAGKKILPGVVTHSTNLIEHPELVADRIGRFAEAVGADNVIASTDCGLGGRVHPQIAWAKLKALAEGAELASKRLYSKVAA